MELVAFMGIVAVLLVASLWRGQKPHAKAFLAVLCGLGVMGLIRTELDGVLGFAVWTLVSYVLLNFPRASAIYLLSAFCYIVELQGQWLLAIQLVSNGLGLAGLVAIWHGTPRGEHRTDLGVTFWGRRPLAVDVDQGSFGNQKAGEEIQ
jgi:hypothetical protein